MRKFLFLVILLSGLSIGARGQDVPDVDLSEIVDLSGLPEATTAASLRYWFDSASDNLYASDLTGGTVSVASLVDGIHVVHYQVVDNNRVPGVSVSKLFIKTSEVATVTKLRYWFDADANSVKTTTTLSGATTIDVSALVEGIHTVHYQTVDENGAVGIPVSAMFVKMAKKSAVTPTKIRYWFNEDDANAKETALNLENLTLTIDASELPKGEHELHMQLVTEDGTLTPVNSGSFVSVIVKKGDANGDDKVTITDAVAIVNYILGNPSGNFNKEAANINGDVDEHGDPNITITDAVGVVNIILNNGSSAGAPKMELEETDDAEAPEATEPE